MGPDYKEIRMSFNAFMQHSLEEILINGASLELSAKGRMPNALIDLAACAKRGGSHLTLTEASGLLLPTLTDIARAGSGHVTLKD
jgi:hypothetical protein